MKEKVTMKLWKNHRAYILRRFMMIKVIKVIIIMITPNPNNRLNPR
jgi:hypothetical protein